MYDEPDTRPEDASYASADVFLGISPGVYAQVPASKLANDPATSMEAVDHGQTQGSRYADGNVLLGL